MRTRETNLEQMLIRIEYKLVLFVFKGYVHNKTNKSIGFICFSMADTSKYQYFLRKTNKTYDRKQENLIKPA